MALDATAGLAVGGGEQAFDAKRLAAVLRQGSDEQVGVLDAADQQDGGGVELSRPGHRAAAAPAVADSGGAEEQQQGEGMDKREAGGSGRSRCRQGCRGEHHGADGGTGGDGQQVADGGKAPVLQGEAERDAGQQQADGTERDGP